MIGDFENGETSRLSPVSPFPFPASGDIAAPGHAVLSVGQEPAGADLRTTILLVNA